MRLAVEYWNSTCSEGRTFPYTCQFGTGLVGGIYLPCSLYVLRNFDILVYSTQ